MIGSDHILNHNVTKLVEEVFFFFFITLEPRVE